MAKPVNPRSTRSCWPGDRQMRCAGWGSLGPRTGGLYGWVDRGVARVRSPSPVRRRRHDGGVSVQIDEDLERVDWDRAKARLAADAFDNGRSPAALRLSFEQSSHVALAWVDGELVGMARLLSDGVCNAYLVDVWTDSEHRRQGVASQMMRHLMAKVPGQHIGLQTDDAQAFYASLGFRPQPEFLSLVIGEWLGNDANG